MNYNVTHIFYTFGGTREGPLIEAITRRSENMWKYYKIYWIRQGKKGRKRKIEEPLEPLVSLQKQLIPIFEKYPLHDACMARKGFSITDNAQVHENAKHVLRVDIKECYRSITWCLFNDALKSNTVDIQQTLAAELRYAATACFLWDTQYHNGLLPTGAPTSPIICNIALNPLDYALEWIALKYGYKYTRYIDDLHFSTTAEKRDWGLIDLVKQSVQSFGLYINHKKSQWLTNNSTDNLIITGVRIGQESKVPREYARTVRARLQNLARDNMKIDEETRGCLAYIKSLDGKKHKSLLDYYNRRLNYVTHSGQRPSPE